VIARGGIATLFGLINPIASIVGLLDLGSAENKPCRELIEAVQEKGGKGESPAPAGHR
jgi:hypothetical protein